MIINYLRVAFRNAWNSKLFSLVNVTGLTLGLTFSFLIFVHVRQELNYETHVPDRHLVFRIATKHWAKVQPPLAEELKRAMPEVQSIARLNQMLQPIIQHDDALAFPEFVYFADPSVVDVFKPVFVKGNPKTALDDPASIVITQRLASILFKDGEESIGETLLIDGYRQHTVTGVIQDIPGSTHLKIDALLSIKQVSANDDKSRTWRAVATYVRFQSEADATRFADKLREFEYKFYQEIRTREEVDRNDDYFELNPIDDIHLTSHKEKEAESNSDMMYIYVFSAFGVLIVVIASINFINLFTAQALRRAKEIGVRRAIGAQKIQLTTQFFGEAFLMVFCCGALALLVAWLALPGYNAIASIEIGAGSLVAIDNVALLLALVVTTGILSGLYPAYLISAGTSVGVGGGTTSSKAGFIRRALVSTQFVVSLFLLMATVVVYSQLKFIESKDLGFEKQQIVAVKLFGKLWRTVTEHRDAVRNELLAGNRVTDISMTNRIVGERLGFEGLKLVERPDEPEVSSRHLLADERFVETMGLEIVQGSNFTGEPDSIPSYILNESAARLLGDTALIGSRAKNIAQGHLAGKIVGVIKDFNYASLHTAVDPLVIEYHKAYPDYLLIRLASGDTQAALSHIELTLKKASPGSAIIYTFLDDKLQTLYQKDKGLYQVATVFSVITVIIGTLGLFALAAHSAQARTKEIGIRKVLGASVGHVISLLCRDFVKLILLAVAVAVPLSLYAAREWLSGFNYKVDVAWWMFAAPALVVLLVAFTAIVGQSLRAALANPTSSLKTE